MKTYRSFVDLGKAFDTLKEEVFLNYKGNILEKKGTGYIMSGKYYATLEEVDAALKDSFNALNNSIINKK